MPEKMGEITQLAYNCIKEDLLIMNNELSPMDVLDFLEDEDIFKRIPGLLKETMINAGIPSETCEFLKEYSTVMSFLDDVKDKKIKKLTPLNESDSPSSFANALYSLLSKQEDECKYQKRRKPWARITITRWFSEEKSNQESKSGTSESIKNREDAIAICFALGLDYPASRDFLNKSGHDIFNFRRSDDAVYIYCLINHRPLSVAKELIHKYELVNYHVPEEDFTAHSGNTTILMANQILGNSNWENDDEFFNSFMIPNSANFIKYSRTALIEYYKIKNPVYLLTLKQLVSYEKKGNNTGGFDKRKIQEYIHKTHKDREITIPMSSVQVTYNLINYLPKYSSSNLLKAAQDMFDVHIERIDDGWKEEAFITVNNSLDVVNYIINNYATYSNDEAELKTISDFLTKTVNPYRMLCTWLPSVVNDDEDGSRYIIDNDGNIRKLPSLDYYEEIDDKHIRNMNGDIYEIKITDKRHRSLSESDHLADSVFRHFPQRNFFSKYENHPEKIVDNLSLRKSIILLFYMNYSINLIQEISNPNTIHEELVFGFDDFIESLNSILGKCQLGKLYCVNPFDWLILESIKRLENYRDEEDKKNPIKFLDDVLSYALGDLETDDD